MAILRFKFGIVVDVMVSYCHGQVFCILFLVLFLTILYWTYFIGRRARAFGARLRLLRRPTFWRGVLGC